MQTIQIVTTTYHEKD